MYLSLKTQYQMNKLQQLQCLSFLYNDDLFTAIDYFYELSVVKPLPEILKYIIAYDTIWGDEEKEVLDAVMQDIVYEQSRTRLLRSNQFTTLDYF